MANSFVIPSAVIGLMGRRPNTGRSLLDLINPIQADALDEQMFASAPNGYVESPEGMYFPADGAAQATARQQVSQAAPQRDRVSGWRVLDRVLGGQTISEGLDAERARLQAEAEAPQRMAVAQENERIARALGPQALLAFRTAPDKLGESLGYGYRPQVIGQGGIQSVAATGQRISAPQFDEFGNEYRLNDPLTGTSTVIGTRGPSYAEQAQIARIAADQQQADARLNLDYQRLGQDQQQFDQRLGFDQSKVESRPLSAAQQRQVETYYQDLNSLEGVNGQVASYINMIDSGQLNFSPTANASARVRNALGVSSENSRNQALFRSDMERLRNESLRLNSGVQTEGDAQRAWNELFGNLNDEKVVKAQLQRIQEFNNRAIRLRQQRLQTIEGQQFGGGQPQQSNTPSPPPGFVLD